MWNGHIENTNQASKGNKQSDQNVIGADGYKSINFFALLQIAFSR